MTLARLLHRHQWADSAWNSADLAVEQTCSCGDRRHHLFADLGRFGSETYWHKGPLPFAARRTPPVSNLRNAVAA